MNTEQQTKGRGATERALTSGIEIYTRWEAERAHSPLDRIVEAEFRSRRYLNAGERRWVAGVVYGCVRFQRRQIRLQEELGLPPTADTWIRLWAAAPVVPEGAPADTPLVEERWAPTPPEALRAALARLPGPETPGDYLRVTLSFPDAMAHALEEQLGPEAIAAAQAFNLQAPTTLRINPLQTTRSRMQAVLSGVTPTRYSPWGLELPGRTNIHELPGYREGRFEIQEEASQLAALLVGAEPGQTVVEVGAGAGGKTLVLAALLQFQGRLVALDTSAPRLETLQKRAHRANVAGVEVGVVSAGPDGYWEYTGAVGKRLARLERSADLVLVDAPCTGTGVLRRNPDARWREVDVQAVIQLQATLLAQSAGLVKPGGLLCYVTCAFERVQNEDVIEAFLASPAGAHFAVEPAAPRLIAACHQAALLRPPGKVPAVCTELTDDRDAVEYDRLLAGLTTGPYLRTWPHRHGLDAFFAACLRHDGSW